VRRASSSLLSSGELELTLWVVDQSGGESVDCSLQWHGAYKLKELSTNMARLTPTGAFFGGGAALRPCANYVSCFPGNPDVAPPAFKLIPGY